MGQHRDERSTYVQPSLYGVMRYVKTDNEYDVSTARIAPLTTDFVDQVL